MCDKKDSFGCYEVDVGGCKETSAGHGDHGISQVSTDWRNNVVIMREPGIPPARHLQPPVPGPAVVHIDESPIDLPNQFVKNMYLKYPFLIPKGLPQQTEAVSQRAYSTLYDDLSMYQTDYGHLGEPEPPELVRARGLQIPEPENPPRRLPGVPYIPGTRMSLSPHDSVDTSKPTQHKQSDKRIEKAPPKNVPLPKMISEYDHNYNSLVKYWKSNGLYTEPFMYIVHKSTLPD